MRPSGYLARQWPADAPDGGPAGPATATLMSVTARTAAVVRAIAMAYIGVQIAIWHAFYLGSTWRLAGPAMALAWALVTVCYLLRRCPEWHFAVIDSAVYVALALTAGLWVVPAMRGDTANWLFIMMAGQLLVPVWFARMPLSALLAFISGMSYWTGLILFPEAGRGRSAPASAAAALFAIALAVWFGREAVQRWATGADAALDQADAQARAQYVELTRNIERREHERLLHDTVLNTLTALARGGGPRAAAVSRARHDVRLMEDLLGPAAGRGAQPPADPDGGLLAGVETVAAGLRARGLTVHVAVTGQILGIPRAVAAGMAHAVREALSNVASHARTSQAWVDVSPLGAGDGVQVSVRDAGAGFDPARTPGQARLGLRRSIVERLADLGGRAVIRSAPGRGTDVIMQWPAPLQQAGPGPAVPARPAAAPSVPAPSAAAPSVPAPSAAAPSVAGRYLPAPSARDGWWS
ncbi:MAG TPA: ATP-binding protein [Streptosporangiaceae bacterium]|jgi:signal transduction histidine kinase